VPELRECIVTAVLGPGEVEVDLGLRGGPRVALCPQHISIEWLRAALPVAPVKGRVYTDREAGPVLWGIFPDARHEAVRADVHLQAATLTIDVTEEVTVTSGTLSLEAEEDVVVRAGRDILSRAAEVNRVKGGTVRIN
jgi:hypothetical protein